GFGAMPKLIVITLACFFPIAMSTLEAFEQTDRKLYFYMEMMGATKAQLFFKLELPYAVPSTVAGFKIAATYSVMAAVISEWLGAQTGIGAFMTIATSSYTTRRVFIAIIITMLTSPLSFTRIELSEKLPGSWQRKGDVT